MPYPSLGIGSPASAILGRRYIEALAELSGTASTVPSYDEDLGTNREYTENSQLSLHSGLNFGLSPWGKNLALQAFDPLSMEPTGTI